MNKKKIIKITLLSILAVIVVTLGALGIRYRNIVRIVFNWDNIVSFVNSRKSAEEIEKKMETNKAKMEKIAEENPLINIRGELTAEEAKAYADGKITREEAVKLVKGDATLEEILAAKEPEKKPEEEPKAEKPEDKPADTKTESPPKAQPPKKEETVETQAPAKKEETDKVSALVAELYVVQADFISRLEALGDQAYADYEACHYDRNQIVTIVDSYTGTVGTMEAECDAKVRALLKELEAELKAVGGDLGLVKEIRDYYYDEKSLKKSYYLNKMNDEDYK